MIATDIIKLQQRLHGRGAVVVGVLMSRAIYEKLEDEIGQPGNARGGLQEINGVPIQIDAERVGWALTVTAV